MSTRTITVYKCDVCGTERQSDVYSAGFTTLSFQGEEYGLRVAHACSKACLAELFMRLGDKLLKSSKEAQQT